MQKLQWILIVVLACSTLILGLRGQAMREMAQAEAARALEQAQHARAALEESRQRELIPLEPVEAIVVGVGDGLKVRCDHQPALEQSTEVQVDGQALFREIGWVEVAGRTRQEVEQELTQRYAQFYSDVGAVYVLVRSAR